MISMYFEKNGTLANFKSIKTRRGRWVDVKKSDLLIKGHFTSIKRDYLKQIWENMKTEIQGNSLM